MMKQRYYIFLLFVAMLSYSGYAQKSILRLSQQTLMHEVRETPSPLDGQHIAVNPPRFMWPDKFPHLGPVLDGVEEENHKPEVTYRIRIARDPEFKSEVMTAERNWAFFNPFKLFEKGKWYWQHAYLDIRHHRGCRGQAQACAEQTGDHAGTAETAGHQGCFCQLGLARPPAANCAGETV